MARTVAMARAPRLIVPTDVLTDISGGSLDIDDAMPCARCAIAAPDFSMVGNAISVRIRDAAAVSSEKLTSLLMLLL